jgi:voltage-gated potassium channel Kch
MKFSHPVIKIYSHVGTPQLVFFIALLGVLLLPVYTIDRHSLVSTIVDSFYIGSIYYLAKSNNTRYLKALGFFVLLAFIDAWASYFGFGMDIVLDNFIPVLLLLIAFVFVFKSILMSDEVDLDTVISAISGYILVGMIFGILFYTLEALNPGNFSGGAELTYYEIMYFSFVTMSTLGYGDILPITEAARALVIITTLFGQFYMAIIVGIIVGKFISSHVKK